MDFQALKRALDQLVAVRSAPGVDCSVYIEHREVFRYFCGMKDAEENVKLRGDELFIIYSMTKMLTCVSALQLLEKGAFSLDDPLSKYMPEFSEMNVSFEKRDGKEDVAVQRGMSEAKNDESENGESILQRAKNPITIRHLFSMTAGFGYGLKSKSILNALAEGKKTTVEIAKALSGNTLAFEPGTGYRYSLCHDILGALVELWSGDSLGGYMEKHIFRPLGMKETFFGVPDEGESLGRLASLYVRDQELGYRKIPQACEFQFTREYESGGAGLISSTADYALFLDALACGGVGKPGKRILSEESVDLMRSNQLEGSALEEFERTRKGYGYGLGVRVHIAPERSGSPSPAGEFGWGGAAGAFSLVDPENKLSLTYFQHVRKWDMNLEEMLRNALYESLNS